MSKVEVILGTRSAQRFAAILIALMFALSNIRRSFSSASHDPHDSCLFDSELTPIELSRRACSTYIMILRAPDVCIVSRIYLRRLCVAPQVVQN